VLGRFLEGSEIIVPLSLVFAQRLQSFRTARSIKVCEGGPPTRPTANWLPTPKDQSIASRSDSTGRRKAWPTALITRLPLIKR
jgi:hypothetical protein